jgi:cytochrome P450
MSESVIAPPAHVEASRVIDIDSWLGEPFEADPIEAWRSLGRKQFDGPMYTPRRGGYWVVTRAGDAQTVLTDHEHFSIYPLNPVGRPERPYPDAKLLPMETEPPEHGPYRRRLTKLLSTGRTRSREDDVRRIARALIDPIASGTSCELVSQFARPFPTLVFTHLAGLPADRGDEFVAWNYEMLHGEDSETRRAAGERIEAEVRTVIAARRTHPGDDLISELLYADDEEVTDDEMVGYVFGLWLAALDTTTASIAFAFRFLAEHADHRRELMAEGSLRPSAVEELLRVNPISTPQRTVVADVEIGGAKLVAGDRVVVGIAAVNIDPATVVDPDVVDLHRGANRHATFGIGRHLCAGMHFARSQLTVALEEFHARIPEYTVQEGNRPRFHAGGSFGVLELMLDFPAAAVKGS